jgi:hypothetical protein
MLLLVEDEVPDIRHTTCVPHAPWLPINIAAEHRGVKLAVLMHEHELLAELVLEIRQIASRSLFDRQRHRMTIAHPQQFTLAHPTNITGDTAEARTPPERAVKATIADSASPYGLGLSDDGRFASPKPSKGSILDRR